MITYLILMRIDRADGAQTYVTRSKQLVLRALRHTSNGDRVINTVNHSTLRGWPNETGDQPSVIDGEEGLFSQRTEPFQ